MRRFFRKASGIWAASIVASVCLLAGIAVTLHVASLVRADLISQHKRDATALLSEARAQLEGQISTTVAHGLGIRAFISQMGDVAFDPEDYREIAADLMEENPSIQSIGLAPNNILLGVYPLKPNQAALGLNYRLNVAQWPAIRKAMLTREVVIAGPLELVQGGRALLIRIPVFPAETAGQPLKDRDYWGVATLVLDAKVLLQAAGLANVVNNIRVTIVDNNAPGNDKHHIFGSKGIASNDYVSLPLHLPGGLNWELLGYPETGWQRTGDEIWITQGVGGLLSFVFALMAFLLICEVYKVRSMALQDPLTGLANRRLLEDRMAQLAAMADRTGTGFEIFYVDLDAFKPVNDNHGHAMGDALLIEIGSRLQQQTRQTDTVARVGGDEFIVLTPGNMRRNERNAFLRRLSSRVCEAFENLGTRIDVSASIGSASYPQDAGTIDDLMRVADGRMYAQKARSKTDCSDLAGDELPQTG